MRTVYDSSFFNDPNDPNYNKDQKLWDMRGHMLRFARTYATEHVMIPWGDDVSHYSNFSLGNADRLIESWNETYGDMKMFYSTTGGYIDALKSLDAVWPVRYHDLLPYSDRPGTYWSGFYSSRANDKKLARISSQTLHASNKMFALEAINRGASPQMLHTI